MDLSNRFVACLIAGGGSKLRPAFTLRLLFLHVGDTPHSQKSFLSQNPHNKTNNQTGVERNLPERKEKRRKEKRRGVGRDGWAEETRGNFCFVQLIRIQ